MGDCSKLGTVSPRARFPNTQIDGYSGIDLTISSDANRCLVTSPASPAPFSPFRESIRRPTPSGVDATLSPFGKSELGLRRGVGVAVESSSVNFKKTD